MGLLQLAVIISYDLYTTHVNLVHPLIGCILGMSPAHVIMDRVDINLAF